MHRIVFELKNAHLGAVGFAKEYLGAVPGMTPARYDLIYAIWLEGTELDGGGRKGVPTLEQSELRKVLGLHPSTVSKAIKRLVELGWLERNRSGKSGRTNTIHVTAEGYEAFELARRIVEKRRTVRHWFDRRFRHYPRGWESAHREIQSFLGRLESTAADFGRTAVLTYPLPYILDS